MTLKDLKTALRLREGWKRSGAIGEFKQTEFGLEALPLLEKALDDDFISVVLIAIQCIGKLGPKVLVGAAADMSTPRGLVARLFALGDHVWGYSGCKNCYSTSLATLVQLGYTGKPLLQYIRRNIRTDDDDDFVDSLTGLKAIGSPAAIELLKRSATSRLPKLNKTYARKVQSILSKLGAAPAVSQSQSAAPEWHRFHTLEIKTALWVGDPQLPNADDGLVVKVPAGKYVVECDGAPRRCQAVSKLRVRLESAPSVKRGKKLGETGTDSATIGVCEIAAFEAAYQQKHGADLVQKGIDAQTDGFGVITVPKFPDILMPFVPTGSDGTGPVFALMSGAKRVGIELTFMDEADV